MILSALYRYPVKSTTASVLPSSQVTPSGLPFDRRWMVVDAQGQMLTGRTEARLVQIVADADDTGLTLNAPGRPTLKVPFAAFTEAVTATVWRDSFAAWAGAEEADRWLSAQLGRPARLYYAGEAMARRVKNRPDLPVSFADAYPFLLIGQGSLDELSRRVGRELSMLRFRPNLVVAGAEPFAEDGWKRIRIGEVEFEIVKPCDRCVFTTVDPATGLKSPDQEPLRTLAKFRKTPDGVMFGQNAIALGEGTLAVGMTVEVLA